MIPTSLLKTAVPYKLIAVLLCLLSAASGSKALELLDPISVSVSVTSTYCDEANGTASATAIGGVPPYKFSWTTSPKAETATVKNLPGGIYILTVTDNEGSSVSTTVSIPLSNKPVI